MKRILAIVLVALMTLTVLAGCASKANTTPSGTDANGTATKDEVKKVIKVATNAAFPPYEFIGDNGEITGIDAEIMQLVCDKLGYTCQIEDMEFDSIIASVQSGKSDIGAAGMTVNEDRLKNVNFSDTYTKSKQVIIVPENSAIKTADDLAGKKVGVQLGTTGDIYVSGDIDDGVYPGASVEQYNNGITAVQALTQGKVDAVVIDIEPAKVFIEQNAGLTILPAEYIEEEYAFAIAKDNTQLLEEVNTVLAQIKESGELKAIIDKYIKAE